MKQIELHGGQFAIVDDKDFNELNKYKWYVSHGYVTRKDNGKAIFMHRVIMNTPEGMHTDHINHNKLDNRRENLRIVTNQQNQQNRKKEYISSSKYKGVSWDKNLELWRANIKVDGKNIIIGRYTSEEAAGLAYNIYAIKYFGEFANINQITEKINIDEMTPKSNKTSKYRGVSWSKKLNKWKSEIYLNGKNVHLGLFNSEIEAANTYNNKIIEYNLDRKLNKIKGD
jgi:hypothetical protein